MTHEPRTILVTGGAGFVGSHLAGALVARGDRVIVLDDLSTGRRSNLERPWAAPRASNLEFVEGSILDRARVGALVAKADAVVHLAAVVGVDLVLRDPLRAYEVNVLGTHLLFEAAATAGTPLLFASSSEVYGKSTEVPFTESHDRRLGPTHESRWIYAGAKADGEMLALALHRQRALPVVVARLFNTVGPGQTGEYGMVLPRFTAAALAGSPLRVYGDGSQRRAFCDVRDVVRALVNLLDTPAAYGEIFNVGGEREISILDLAHLVVRTCGRPGDLSRVDLVPPEALAPGRSVDFERRLPDTAKIRALCGWRSEIALERTILDLADALSAGNRD